MLPYISMDLRTKRNSSDPDAPSNFSFSTTHSCIPVVAYAVQLGSVASTLHPLALSLLAATWSLVYEKALSSWTECAYKWSLMQRPYTAFAIVKPRSKITHCLHLMMPAWSPTISHDCRRPQRV